MKESQIKRAVEQGVFDQASAERFRAFLKAEDTNKFSISGVQGMGYFIGGLFALLGIGLFGTVAFLHDFGGQALALLALVLFVVSLRAAHAFEKESGFAGILGAFAIACVPVFVFGVQYAAGTNFFNDGTVGNDLSEFHKWIRAKWIPMEVATVVVGMILLYRYRIGFMMMPVAVALWYMSMDLAPLIIKYAPENYNGPFGANWSFRMMVSMYFGLIVMAACAFVDRVTKRDPDLTYWITIAGVAAFWAGLTFARQGNEFEQFMYFLASLAMIVAGSFLERGAYFVAGTLGATSYLIAQNAKYSKDFWSFSLGLIIIGITILVLTRLWVRYGPAKMKALRDAHANKPAVAEIAQ